MKQNCDYLQFLQRVCAVDLDWGIDWPVNPQIKLTRAQAVKNLARNLAKCVALPSIALQNPMVLIGPVQLVPARCPTRQ